MVKKAANKKSKPQNEEDKSPIKESFMDIVKAVVKSADKKAKKK